MKRPLTPCPVPAEALPALCAGKNLARTTEALSTAGGRDPGQPYSPSLVHRWLDDKMAAAAVGKLIPPAAVLLGRLCAVAREEIAARLSERLHELVDFERRVDALYESVEEQIAGAGAAAPDLVVRVSERLSAAPELAWSAPVDEEAARVADGADYPRSLDNLA
jgi:hypothetical protein